MMSLEEIEEMAKVLCNHYETVKRPDMCKGCVLFKLASCSYRRNAILLSNAGYRKAENVQKETASNILDRYKDLANEEEICVEMLDLLNDDIGYDYGIESEDILREEPKGK